MAHDPSLNNNNASNDVMNVDDMKVSPYIADNNSNPDSMGVQHGNDLMDDNGRHAIINQRTSDAPEPPANSSALTLESLNKHNYNNPTQSMLGSFQQNNNQSNIASGFGVADMLGIHTGNQPPSIMVDQLIEMGFDRKKVIYALNESERMNGVPSVDFAVTWIYDNPNFQIPDNNAMNNINTTVTDFLGVTNNNPTNNNIVLPPPNNSPTHDHNPINPNTKPLIASTHVHDDNNIIFDYLSKTNGYSKSNKIYNNSDTLKSASNDNIDLNIDEKVNITVNNNNIKNIKHSTNTSNVASMASELSQISQLSTANNNNQSNANTNATKQHIHSLYNDVNNLVNKAISIEPIPSDLKMVIVVRKDLKMSSGKVAAQCCHGCLGVVLDIINKQHIQSSNNNSSNNNRPLYDLNEVLTKWRNIGEKKIVLQCENEKKLLELKDQCTIFNIPYYLVTDAGHTQIKAGSKTVLAIGPYPADYIDQLTAKLKLY